MNVCFTLARKTRCKIREQRSALANLLNGANAVRMVDRMHRSWSVSGGLLSCLLISCRSFGPPVETRQVLAPGLEVAIAVQTDPRRTHTLTCGYRLHVTTLRNGARGPTLTHDTVSDDCGRDWNVGLADDQSVVFRAGGALFRESYDEWTHVSYSEPTTSDIAALRWTWTAAVQNPWTQAGAYRALRRLGAHNGYDDLIRRRAIEWPPALPVLCGPRLLEKDVPSDVRRVCRARRGRQRS